MNEVASRERLNQAVSVLGWRAQAFLCEVHRGDATDVRAAAQAQLEMLRQLFGDSDGLMVELPAYSANITNWRAVARLAGTVVPTTRAG